MAIDDGHADGGGGWQTPEPRAATHADEFRARTHEQRIDEPRMTMPVTDLGESHADGIRRGTGGQHHGRDELHPVEAGNSARPIASA
jgi:hypothetical protein